MKLAMIAASAVLAATTCIARAQSCDVASSLQQISEKATSDGTLCDGYKLHDASETPFFLWADQVKSGEIYWEVGTTSWYSGGSVTLDSNGNLVTTSGSYTVTFLCYPDNAVEVFIEGSGIDEAPIIGDDGLLQPQVVTCPCTDANYGYRCGEKWCNSIHKCSNGICQP